MSGGGASEYGTAVYGAAGQQHAAHGNMIAMSQAGGAGNIIENPVPKKELSELENKRDLTAAEKTRKQAIKAVLEGNKPLGGGRKSNMNFMMVPKMFMRMTRSRKHRRASKRHHGKSRKHRK